MTFVCSLKLVLFDAKTDVLFNENSTFSNIINDLISQKAQIHRDLMSYEQKVKSLKM